jgi:hypothetical protein
MNFKLFVARLAHYQALMGQLARRKTPPAQLRF